MSTARITVDRGEPRKTVRTVPTRGIVVALVAVGLGACLIQPTAGEIPWTELAILGAMAVASFLGANEARRLALRQQAQVATEEVPEAVVGPWMTVVVNPGGPADAAGMAQVPKSPTRDDPERRSLLRRAEERLPVGASRR